MSCHPGCNWARARVASTQKVFTTGDILTTNQQLDIAIEGQGFFQIEEANGEVAYSRDGQFYRNSDGIMVTSQGLPLVPNIQIPETATGITIAENGVVSAKVAGQAEAMELGQITLRTLPTRPGSSPEAITCTTKPRLPVCR